VTNSHRAPGPHRIARIRLAKIREPEAATRDRPPVFHVFEELYARTLREMQAPPSSAAVAASDR
jgi:hypothetical protein